MRSVFPASTFLPLALCLLAITACEESNRPGPAEPPTLEARGPAACSLKDATRAARGFFPGKGQNSILDQVRDVLGLMEDDCAAGDAAAYTARWFDIAEITQSVLATGTAGDPSDGQAFFAATLGVLGPDGARIFDPCGGDPGCSPWDGFPATPDFASVLGSPDGAWAVVSGSDAVCSGFRYPCGPLDAEVVGDAWGAEPSDTWGAALNGRTTLVFGAPIPGPSPTGEPLLDTELPAYQWLMVPDPAEFGVGTEPQAGVEVGLCSTATSQIDEILVQKGNTVLTEAVIDFCSNQVSSVAGAPRSSLDRLANVLGSLLSPVPTPLIAAVASQGPGGSAGSFTDFYAIDLPREALIVIPSEPARGKAGQAVLAEDGQPFRIRAVTSSMASPLENALITLEIIGNNGLIPSGNGASGANLSCDGFVCTGRTQADQEAAPGELELGLVITKPGSYTLCFSGSLPPLDFETAVCSEKFVVNP